MKRPAPVLVREIHPHLTHKEKPKHINKYLQEIKPLLIILRVFGRFPFIFEDDRVLFKPLSWPVWYTVFLVVLQLLGTCYILDILVSLGFSSRGNFDDSLYFICLTVSVVQSFAVPFTYWFESLKSLKYINDWYRFQEEFGKDELDFALTRGMKMAAIIHAPILLIMLFGGAYLFNDLRVITFSPVLTAMGSFSASLFIFSTTLYELRSASKVLLKRFIGTGCRNIHKNRILWLRLSNLTTGFGEIIGHTGVVALVLLFTTFVLLTYSLLSLAIDYSFNKSFCALLCASLLCISAQFFVCDAAYRTTKEIGEKFSSKLNEINTSSLNHKDQFEINLFIQTMRTNPPIVHFMGFMIVDRALFLKFISDTLKYLVVLIQFRVSSVPCSVINGTTEDFNELSVY